jgi:hypothetical protein
MTFSDCTYCLSHEMGDEYIARMAPLPSPTGSQSSVAVGDAPAGPKGPPGPTSDLDHRMVEPVTREDGPLGSPQRVVGHPGCYDKGASSERRSRTPLTRTPGRPSDWPSNWRLSGCRYPILTSRRGRSVLFM